MSTFDKVHDIVRDEGLYKQNVYHLHITRENQEKLGHFTKGKFYN